GSRRRQRSLRGAFCALALLRRRFGRGGFDFCPFFACDFLDPGFLRLLVGRALHVDANVPRLALGGHDLDARGTARVAYDALVDDPTLLWQRVRLRAGAVALSFAVRVVALDEALEVPAADDLQRPGLAGRASAQRHLLGV